MQRINHPFIIKYIDNFIYQDKQCIVTEYIAGEDLYKYLKKNKNGLTEQ